MHHQFTPDIYTTGQHTHQNKMHGGRRYYSEQIIRNRTRLPSPSSYSLNSSNACHSASLQRVDYSPKKLFSLPSPAPNHKAGVCFTPSQNIISLSFDKYSPIDENSSLCIRSTPTQIGTPSFDKYASPYDTPRQNVRNASSTNFSADASGNNWSLLNNISKTPMRARAYSIDSPQNISQLLNLHFSPCSCNNNAKRVSFASPVTSDPFVYSSSASSPSSSRGGEATPHKMPMEGTALKRWQSATEIPSPLNIYMRTRKRHASGSATGHHCHACNWYFDEDVTISNFTFCHF